MACSMLRAVRTAEGSAVGVGPLALWTVVVSRWPLLAEHRQADPDAVRLVDRPPEDVDRSSPAPVAVPVEHPPDSLRAVVDHGAGPLDADTIRAACGQAVGRATPVP